MNVTKILIAVTIVFLAAGVLILFVFPRFSQTAWITDKALSFKDTAVTYIKDNAALVAGSVGTLVTVGGAAASKISSVKQQAQSSIDSVKSQADSIKAEKDKLTQSFTTEKTGLETQIADLKTQVETTKQEASSATSKIQNLQGQVQSAQDQNAAFVKSLMASANGALVTNPVDGKVYSVLKVPPEVHIK